MATVTKGRIVLVTLRDGKGPLEFNGEAEHPAIVTRVFSPVLINARVFVDGQQTLWRTSIPHLSEADAGYGGDTWRWPPRPEEYDPTEGARV